MSRTDRHPGPPGEDAGTVGKWKRKKTDREIPFDGGIGVMGQTQREGRLGVPARPGGGPAFLLEIDVFAGPLGCPASPPPAL